VQFPIFRNGNLAQAAPSMWPQNPKSTTTQSRTTG